MMGFDRRIARKSRLGGVLIEFMLILPFYCTLFFGAIEFGQMHWDRLQLNNACREGVRRAAIGKPVADIRTTITSLTSTLHITDGQIVAEYNDAADGTGSWVAMSDNDAGDANSVPTGYLCRVRIREWPHQFVTGSFFSWLPGASGTSVPMSAVDIMARE